MCVHALRVLYYRHKKKVKEMQQKLREMEVAGKVSIFSFSLMLYWYTPMSEEFHVIDLWTQAEDAQKLSKELEELKKQEDHFKKKEAELEKKERVSKHLHC